MLASLLAHPLTRGLDIDAPETTALRRCVIQEKPFLRRIYAEWYTALAATVPGGPGDVLELGSGAGFFRESIPGLITSEVFPVAGVDRVIDAALLPFSDDSLRGIVMTNVFHHLPDVRAFLVEAARCVRPGGVLAMVEPWNTAWSRFVYQRFHHEPFVPDASDWEFPRTGPLSGANGALPWMVFERDRERLEREFPVWRVEEVTPIMPLRYLLSGGVSLRALAPAWSFNFWRWLEGWMSSCAMFARITLTRSSEPDEIG